jgi:hypothetical protein
MTRTCEIQSIGADRRRTTDNNPAVARVRTKERTEWHAGQQVRYPPSRWFYLCAEHKKQLSNPGMEIWECEPRS